MPQSLNEPLLLLQIHFDLKKKEISNFFLPHSLTMLIYSGLLQWGVDFSILIDDEQQDISEISVLTEKRVPEPICHSKIKPLVSGTVNAMNTWASAWIWLSCLKENFWWWSFTQVWTVFQGLEVFFIIPRHITFLFYSLWGPWDLVIGGRKVIGKGLGDLIRELGVRFSFLGHILYLTVSCLLISSQISSKFTALFLDIVSWGFLSQNRE